MKVKLRLPLYLYSVTPYLAKRSTANIDTTFLKCNILMFAQNSLVLIPYLLTYSQKCFVTTLLCHIVFMRNVFCFNGFNGFTWFNMGRITKDDHCLLKTIKTENITHKQYMTY